jgi:hypothetical protein
MYITKLHLIKEFLWIIFGATQFQEKRADSISIYSEDFIVGNVKTILAQAQHIIENANIYTDIRRKVMKIKIRPNTFETNSSSTHSMVIAPENEFQRWIRKEIYFHSWQDRFATIEEMFAKIRK